MKIISKFKDYYDYLQGIYGQDEKLTLDRTNFTHAYTPSENTIQRFYICGMVVDGFFKGGKWLYGNEIEEYDVKQYRVNFFPLYYNVPTSQYDNRHTTKVLKQPTLWSELFQVNPNEKHNCPILARTVYGDGIDHFPILREYDFHKVFTAEQMWVMLIEWLGKVKDIPDNRTNKEKIQSNGFDLKTSFRH